MEPCLSKCICLNASATTSTEIWTWHGNFSRFVFGDKHCAPAPPINFVQNDTFVLIEKQGEKIGVNQGKINGMYPQRVQFMVTYKQEVKETDHTHIKREYNVILKQQKYNIRRPVLLYFILIKSYKLFYKCLILIKRSFLLHEWKSERKINYRIYSGNMRPLKSQFWS